MLKKMKKHQEEQQQRDPFSMTDRHAADVVSTENTRAAKLQHGKSG